MKIRKHPLCILILLLALITSGCAKSTDTQVKTSETTDAAATSDRADTSDSAVTGNASSFVRLRLPLVTGGMVPTNLAHVQEALNSYLAEKSDIQITFEPVELDSLFDYYLIHKSKTDGPDFLTLLPGTSQLSAIVHADLVLPLDELLETKGQDLLEIAGDVLPIGQLNHTQYMIPQVKTTYCIGSSIEFNKALVKKYGIDLSTIKTLDDLEPYLALIHENEPDVIPISGTPGSTGFTSLLSNFDNLTDNLGVLDFNEDFNLNVVNWYETDSFMALAKRMHKWYQKGYIYKDVLLLQKTATELVSEGKAFCLISTYMPRADEGTDLNSEGALVEVRLQDIPQILGSNQMGLEGICISSNCQHPEKAMEFLNLLYTDRYIVNLIEYGLKGENYTLTPDGLIDRGNVPFLIYGQPLNQKLRINTVEDGKYYEEKCASYEENTVESPALGFVFDEAPVLKEVGLCQAVIDHYFSAIDCGCVDPETEIPVFVSELKAAGIDTIIAEKQRQLDEWKQRQDSEKKQKQPDK